jgi:hypothetical protein
MNWRGISGIYAGLAVVLGGAWLWVQFASVWALGAVGGGLVLAAASVAHIVIARRGPRPAKVAKAPRVWRSKAAPVANDEADAIARTRMAAIAGRTTGRVVFADPEPVQPLAEIGPEAELAEPDLIESALPEPVDSVDEDPPLAEPEPESIVEVPDAIEADGGSVDVIDADPSPVMAVDEPIRSFDAPDAALAEDEASIIADIASDTQEAPVVALDNLPGFPWTARFIGLWAREVRYACPDDLRGAVGHWQRWADAQAAGTPLVEEAAEEFKAMLSAWRECGAGVPGLASDDAVARQLAEEAEQDAGLAEFLPPVLRVTNRQDA